MAGKKFGLSEDKINLLKKLDFIFEFQDLPERYSFHERFAWLKKYKEEHGTCWCVIIYIRRGLESSLQLTLCYHDRELRRTTKTRNPRAFCEALAKGVRIS